MPYVMPSEAEILEAILRYSNEALKMGDVPTFGSARWSQLSDDNPAKSAAVIRAALAHWNFETQQAEAHAQASRAISKAHNWARQSLELGHDAMNRRRYPWLFEKSA
jgi:hypothetical protein